MFFWYHFTDYTNNLSYVMYGVILQCVALCLQILLLLLEVVHNRIFPDFVLSLMIGLDFNGLGLVFASCICLLERKKKWPAL